MPISFHPLDFPQWKLYISSEEFKSDSHHDNAYNELFSFFPLCAKMWLQYAARARSDYEKLTILHRATVSCRYSPQLWYKYLICGLQCVAQGVDVDIKGMFLQGIEFIGAHPHSHDIWRLLLDTDLLDDDLLMYMLSCPIPSLASLWDKLMLLKHPATTSDGILLQLKEKADQRWRDKQLFEASLKKTEYGGEAPVTSEIIAWHDYIGNEILNIDKADSIQKPRVVAEVCLLFERFLIAYPIVPDVWRRYSLWLFSIDEKNRALEVAYRGVSTTLQLTPSAHLLYASILEACGAFPQAREVLHNLTENQSCGHTHLESHLSRIYFEQRNGEPNKCLELFDDAINLLIEKNGPFKKLKPRERNMLLYSLICAKTSFMSDIFPGKPKQAVAYIYDTLTAVNGSLMSDEIISIIECAYNVLCKLPSSVERDQQISDLLCAALTRSGTFSVLKTKFMLADTAINDGTQIIEEGEIIQETNKNSSSTIDNILSTSHKSKQASSSFATAPVLVQLAENFCLSGKCFSVSSVMKLHQVIDDCKRDMIRSYQQTES